jgi:O-antigen/teichoic acid export membrane protein
MSDRLSRNALLVPGGRICLVAMGFAGNILIVRELGPAHFGVYALYAAFIKIVSGCLGDALDLAVLRRVPLYVHTDRPRALRVFWAALWLRLAAGGGTLAIAVLLHGWIAEMIFGGERDVGLLLLAAAGVLGELLVRAVSSYLQSAELFSRFLALDGMLQGGRISILVTLIALNALDLQSAVLVYVGSSYVVALAGGSLMLPRDVLRVIPVNRDDIAEISAYSKWVLLAMAISAVYERLDVFLLGYFKGPEQVGVYAAAFTLAIIPEFVGGAVATVLQPRIVPLYKSGAFPGFAQRYFRWAVPAALAAATAAVLLSGPFIPLLLSARYVASIPLFQILVVGTLFSALANPLHGGLVAMTVPRRMVLVTTAGFLVMLVAGSLVIPLTATLGAAVLVGIVRVGIGVSVLWIARDVVRSGVALTADTPEAAPAAQCQAITNAHRHSSGEQG